MSPMALTPVLVEANLRAELADLAPRMASYWTTEGEAGFEGAQELADLWSQLGIRLRADIVERERQQATRRLVLAVRKAQGRLPDGSVR